MKESGSNVTEISAMIDDIQQYFSSVAIVDVGLTLL